MGNEYRDALSAAQRRIDSLEKELELARAGIARPPPSYGLGVMVVGVAVMAVVFVGAVIAGIRSGHEAPEVAPAPAAAVPAPAVVEHYGVSFYTGAGSRPHLVDIDGDGKKEIVSLFWSSSDDAPLRVGAVDRETFAVKWMRGSFPSQWSGAHTHLAIAGGYAVVTDSREKVHLVDLKTGVEVHTADLAGGTRAVCHVRGAPDLVALQRASGSFKILELGAGFAMRDAKKTEEPACTSGWVSCDDKPAPSADKACRTYQPAASKYAKMKGFQSYGVGQALGDKLVVEGKIGPDADQRGALLAVDRKSLAYLWDAEDVVDGEKLHLGGHVEHELAAGRVLSFYQTSRGDFRLLARALDDGKTGWSIIVPQGKEGTYAGDFFVEDGEAFLFLDHGLVVVDASNGDVRRAPIWF